MAINENKHSYSHKEYSYGGLNHKFVCCDQAINNVQRFKKTDSGTKLVIFTHVCFKHESRHNMPVLFYVSLQSR